MSFNKLKGKMRENGITQEKMSAVLGITIQCLNAKLNNRSQFTIREVVDISNLLDIEDLRGFFFENQIPKTQRHIKNGQVKNPLIQIKEES